MCSGQPMTSGGEALPSGRIIVYYQAVATRTLKLVKPCAVLVMAAVLTMAGAATARAEDSATEQARQHYQNGTKSYDLGHWDKAIVEFEKAYELRPDPSFLYNLAQTYRRKGDAKRALDLYKNYLLKVPKSPLRDEVEEKIAALQKQIDETAAKPAATSIEPALPVSPGTAQGGGATLQTAPDQTAPSPGSTAQPTPAPQPENASPAGGVVPVAQPEAASGPAGPVPMTVEASSVPRPGRGLRIAGIVAGSIGAVAVGAGVIFGLRAQSLSDKVAGAKQFNASDDSAGQFAETLQWTFYGIGAGALVAGGVLYYFGWRSSQGAPSGVSLSPVVGPGTAGLSAMGVF